MGPRATAGPPNCGPGQFVPACPDPRNHRLHDILRSPGICVVIVNLNLRMLTMSKPGRRMPGRPEPPSRNSRKTGEPHHHGNLPRRRCGSRCTIPEQGVDALTLRGVVSAWEYLHGAVPPLTTRGAPGRRGRRGFRMPRTAWPRHGVRGAGAQSSRRWACLRRFPWAPSHYRGMFGGERGPATRDSLAIPAHEAFQVLLHAITQQQAQGPFILISRDNWRSTSRQSFTAWRCWRWMACCDRRCRRLLHGAGQRSPADGPAPGVDRLIFKCGMTCEYMAVYEGFSLRSLGDLLFFETRRRRCGRGRDLPDLARVGSLEQAVDGTWRSPLAVASNQGTISVTTTRLTESATGRSGRRQPHPLRLMPPDPRHTGSVAGGHRTNWYRLEAAKRRLCSRSRPRPAGGQPRPGPGAGLAFEFLADDSDLPVTTGHEGGVITVNSRRPTTPTGTASSVAERAISHARRPFPPRVRPLLRIG